MTWFKRSADGIKSTIEDKIEAPDGLWTKCPDCKKPTHIKELIKELHVCPHCGFHHKVGSKEYFEILFDNQAHSELDANMISGNPLNFTDTKDYEERLLATRNKTKLNDAVRTASGRIGGIDAVVSCMDFSFIGGSMGSVVGEKISRGIDAAIKQKCVFIMISKSGGARMMEGAISLMQMAKTSARLAQLDKEKLPYISLLTNPTTGGVSASYAMLGDFNIAEPGALIGFAGPRVIRETIGKDLPDGFQSSEFLKDHGFIDFISDRRELKEDIVRLLKILQPY